MIIGMLYSVVGMMNPNSGHRANACRNSSLQTSCRAVEMLFIYAQKPSYLMTFLLEIVHGWMKERAVDHRSIFDTSARKIHQQRIREGYTIFAQDTTTSKRFHLTGHSREGSVTRTICLPSSSLHNFSERTKQTSECSCIERCDLEFRRIRIRSLHSADGRRPG